MSRIGKQPVKVPSGVKVELSGQQVKVSGSSSSLILDVRPEIKVAYDSATGEITVTRHGESRLSRALHGTIRSLIANMVLGVTQGFHKDMKAFGAGYGVKVQNNELAVTAGMAKPAMLAIPAGITVDIKIPNARGSDIPAEFTIRGADKCIVGQFAAKVRQVRPPEPYQGKGVRYADEVVKRKVGKAFTSGS